MAGALTFFAALTVSIAPVQASVLVQNFMKSAVTKEASVHVFAYGTGTTKTYDVATDWSAGTFTNTTTNAAGDLLLSGSPVYQTSGSWVSPVLDSGGTGLSAVYGVVSATTSATDFNLAIGKTASQSTTAFSGTANFGNDGNTSGAYGYAAGSVFHTDFEQGWWQVDLGSSVTVKTVKLWNRTDCCTTRASNLWVTLSPTPYTGNMAVALATLGVSKVLVSGAVGTPTTATFTGGATGRYLRVWQPIIEYLHLAEVQVFADVPTGSGAATFQIATSASNAGPWTYVGPDGTTATSYTGTAVPVPYSADGNRYFRLRATLTGPGGWSPIVNTLNIRYALAEIARNSGSVFSVTAPTGSPSWIARVKTDNSTFLAKPFSLVLGTGSVWNATSANFSLDSPAVTCCSSPFITVALGIPTQTGAASVNTYAAGAGAGLSVVATRTNAIAATGVMTATVRSSNGTAVEIPLSVTLP